MNKDTIQTIKEVERLSVHKKECELSYPDIARGMGVNPMSVYNWIKGRSIPSQMARRIIREYLARRKG